MHIIGLAALEKLVKNTEYSQVGTDRSKAKRGRPQATRRALVHQPEEAPPVEQQVVVPASHTDTQATTSGTTQKKRKQSADTTFIIYLYY